jgi:hypothetical protein
MGAAFVLVLVLLAASDSLLAQCGEEPAAPWSLMNATLERISVDTNSSRNDNWRDASLPPSDSVAFTGELTHVKVRLKSSRVLQYDQREIALIRTQSHLQRGDWLVDQTGLRFVSCTEREHIFRRLRKWHMKSLSRRSSQPLAVPRSSFPMTSNLNSAAKLGPACDG